ncbi:MAG: anti-sigma factor, partial [Polyangiaceae bacterium]
TLEAPSLPKIQRSSRALAFAGWLAAAACLVLAAASWLRAPREVTKVVTVEAPLPRAPKAPTIAEQRETLRKGGKDVVEIAWSTTKDTAAQGATGNVVWSTSDQRGYMHFHGLAANDRSQSTYQLWIFDKERDAKYPVDGGTFDIDSTGDVIVPIVAKIHVNRPTLFAVTVEKPGGVVVSKRERIVVTAAVN